MYLYQKNNEYFAQISGGMEDLGVEELEGLGATNVRKGFRGVYFKAKQDILYHIVYNARLISRVIAPLVKFSCEDDNALYRKAKSVNWFDFISVKNTFAVFANVSNSTINHSQFAGLRLKDAIVDFFREKGGVRPNVDKLEPDMWFNLHIRNDKAVIGLDVSGGSLHKRGYRVSKVDAPMQETLAAAIIKISEWDGSVPLYDPMCGSGTLLCEALMHYLKVPSGFLRGNTGIPFLPDCNETLLQEQVEASNNKIKTLPAQLLFGSDISQHSILATRKNTRRLPEGSKITLARKNFEHLGNIENAVIVCNPPYGIRLKQIDDLKGFYKRFGDFLKQNCKGSTAYIYFGEREYIKHLGLKASFKKELKNGGLDGRLVKVELY